MNEDNVLDRIDLLDPVYYWSCSWFRFHCIPCEDGTVIVLILN